MGKGITGLDRTQLSCLVEMVLGDTEISLAPRILGPLAAVRATLMYLRTNTSQEAIAEIMGVSQPTISRAISVVTRIIARVLGPVLATVEEVPHGGVHIIDGTLLPCWSWKDRTDLWSGKHKRTGLSLQVLVSPAAPAVGLRPATGGHPRHQGHHHLRSLGRDRPLLLHRR